VRYLGKYHCGQGKPTSAGHTRKSAPKGKSEKEIAAVLEAMGEKENEKKRDKEKEKEGEEEKEEGEVEEKTKGRGRGRGRGSKSVAL